MCLSVRFIHKKQDDQNLDHHRSLAKKLMVVSCALLSSCEQTIRLSPVREKRHVWVSSSAFGSTYRAHYLLLSLPLFFAFSLYWTLFVSSQPPCRLSTHIHIRFSVRDLQCHVLSHKHIRRHVPHHGYF